MLKASSGSKTSVFAADGQSDRGGQSLQVLLDEALEQLRSDGEEVLCPEVGAMIEVPSVIHVIDQLQSLCSVRVDRQ